MSAESGADTGASQKLAAAHHNAARKRRYAKAIALLLVAVLAGVIIGVGGAVLFMNKRMHRVPPRPDAIADAMVNRMGSMLSITPDEDARLRAIAHNHMKRVDEIREKSFDDMHGVFRLMNDEIDTLLGPERAGVWKEYRDKRAREKGFRSRKKDGKDKREPPQKYDGRKPEAG